MPMLNIKVLESSPHILPVAPALGTAPDTDLCETRKRMVEPTPLQGKTSKDYYTLSAFS